MKNRKENYWFLWNDYLKPKREDFHNMILVSRFIDLGIATENLVIRNPQNDEYELKLRLRYVFELLDCWVILLRDEGKFIRFSITLCIEV